MRFLLLILSFSLLFSSNIFAQVESPDSLALPADSLISSEITELPVDTLITKISLDTLDIPSIFSSKIPYEWISYRMKVKMEINGGVHNFQIFYVNKIDSIIYINANIFGGIELGRFVITPEEVIFLNKIEKNYYQGDMSIFEHLTGIPLDFYMIQSLFNAVDFVNFEDRLEIIDHESEIQLVASNRCHKTKKLCIFQDLLLDNHFQLLKHNISVDLSGNSIEVTYSQYSAIDSLTFFNFLSAEIPEAEIKVAAELKNLKLNTPGPTHVNIPSNFCRFTFCGKDE